MKAAIHFFSLAVCLFITTQIFGQYNWVLNKDKDGIKIYLSAVKNSNFKSIKVECTLEGTTEKLMNIINDISHHKDWTYCNKTSYLIKSISPNEYYYYTETSAPWPMSNRDAVVHVKVSMDSLDHSLTINELSEPNYIPEKKGIVRVPRSVINWYVTTPATNTIHIVYMFYAEPGGAVPSWLANIFADKGPYESFKKLSVLLKR